MSDIPKAMKLIETAILLLGDVKHTQAVKTLLEFALEAMPREKTVRRTPVKSTRMTSALKGKIAAYAAANPKASQQEIGDLFNVNPGRVSDALRK